MKRILFWRDPADAPFATFHALFGHPVLPDPRDYVRAGASIPYADRMTVVRALELRSTMNPTGGEILQSEYGYAACRVCGVQLGNSDFFGHGFVWPEKAEHYIESHGVWHPDHTLLLHAVRTAPRGVSR